MRSKEPELRTLLVRIQRRDEEAMGDFYKLTRLSLISYIQKIVYDVTTAEEVLQDTLCHIWFNASAYEEERSSLPMWLYMIARSRAIDTLRRHRRDGCMQPLDEHREQASVGNVEAEQMMKWNQNQLRDRVQGLGPVHRQLIYMAFYHGFSHSEIASVLNLPLGTVKSRLRGAVGRLRETVEPSEAAMQGF